MSLPDVASNAWGVALLAAFLFSALDALRKKIADAVDPLTLAFVFALAQVLFFAVAVWSMPAVRVPTEMGYWIPALLGGLTGALGAYWYITAVAIADLGLTVPYLALTPALTTLAGLFLGEIPNAYQVVGLVLVVFGGLFLQAGRSLPELLRSLTENRGSLYACLAAVAWSLSPVFDKQALQYAPVYFHGFCIGVFAVLGFVLVMYRRGVLRRERWSLPLGALVLFASGVFVAALGTQLVAIQYVWVGGFEGLKRAIGLVIAFFWGSIFFDERLSRRKGLAAVSMTTGVLLLVLT